MKIINNFLFLILLKSLATSVLMADTTSLDAVNFEIKTQRGLEKIENVLLSPENLLKIFRPAGALVTNYSVSQGQFQFKAKKTVFLITKTVFVHAVFDVERSSACSSKLDTGYLAKMDFANSDDLITDNIEKYEALICVREKTVGILNIQVKARLFKSRNYNSVVGPIISDMIAAQTKPLVDAISSEVKINKI